MKVAALITCHNRREKTMACIAALRACDIPVSVTVQIIVVDDGSSDGSAAEISARYPDIVLINGSGALFWNKGMYQAFCYARRVGFDAYLWLNDDTMLFPDALARVFTKWRSVSRSAGSGVIVVGATQDPDTGSMTYGGLARVSKFRPLKLEMVDLAVQGRAIHTMNGNCVFIPHDVAERVGNLDPRFPHAMGDVDYGLRATALGIGIVLADGFVGKCARNSVAGTYLDSSLSRNVRMRKVRMEKGLPFGGWWVLVRKHTGLLAPIYWVMPYLRILLSSK